jgi:hypothetical protein
MPQVSPPQGGQPQGAPQGGQQDGGGPAVAAIKEIQAGFQALGQLLQQSQGQVDPQDMKLFQAAVQATDNFIQSLSGPAQPSQPKPQQSGPQDANANQGAQPAM